jgi:hypothetical protein
MKDGSYTESGVFVQFYYTRHQRKSAVFGRVKLEALFSHVTEGKL